MIQPAIVACAKILEWLPASATIGKRTHYPPFRNTGDWNVRRIAVDVWNAGIRTYIYCTLQVYAYDDDRKWKSIRTPTRIVHGRHDHVVPVENAVALKEMLPEAKLIILEKGNHILVLNYVDEVSKIIFEFLETLIK